MLTRYSHRSELDEIEMELSFLLQSATNAVLNILPHEVVDEYLGIINRLMLFRAFIYRKIRSFSLDPVAACGAGMH